MSKIFESGTTKVQALDDVTLDIRSGEFVVLLGPSGCGKTTLLRLIGGFSPPTRGSVVVSGSDLWTGQGRSAEAVENMGMVFQEPNLFPWFNVARNISLPLELRGHKKAVCQHRARELCQLVGIDGFEERWPRELSGGMRQRAAIGRALSYDPKILLMDEPFGALDAMTRDLMNAEIQRIWLEIKSTVIFVTHSISEAVFLADRIILLSPRPGRIFEEVEVNFNRPRDSSVELELEFRELVKHLRAKLSEATSK